MGKSRNLLFSICSLLMASLFALSVSFQFNDPDWYFWIPLYAAACIVNLVNALSTSISISLRKLPKFTLGFGLFLLTKVLIDGHMQGISGIWALDMKERLVREKFGSGLVIISMFLHLKASSVPNIPTMANKAKSENHVTYGMAVLVGLTYGLSFGFFVFHSREMEF